MQVVQFRAIYDRTYLHCYIVKLYINVSHFWMIILDFEPVDWLGLATATVNG